MSKQNSKELVLTPYNAKAQVSKSQVNNEDGINSIILKSPDQTQNVHMLVDASR